MEEREGGRQSKGVEPPGQATVSETTRARPPLKGRPGPEGHRPDAEAPLVAAALKRVLHGRTEGRHVRRTHLLGHPAEVPGDSVVPLTLRSGRRPKQEPDSFFHVHHPIHPSRIGAMRAPRPSLITYGDRAASFQPGWGRTPCRPYFLRRCRDRIRCPTAWVGPSGPCIQPLGRGSRAECDTRFRRRRSFHRPAPCHPGPRSARPGRAPVWRPFSQTSTPFTTV